mmetsp:Transcript_6722/g.15838  ORF Transcript_6722/g.15838 Transcript_6722/m.15838 type:complete len:246 (-) Transcript_6722:1549-2286(-)
MAVTCNMSIGTHASPCSSWTRCLSRATRSSVSCCPICRIRHATGAIPPSCQLTPTTRQSSTGEPLRRRRSLRIAPSTSAAPMFLPLTLITSGERPITVKEPSGQRLPRSPRSKAATRWPSSSTKLDQYIARNCSRSPAHASVPKASKSPQIVRIIAGHGCVITSRPFLLPPPNSLAIGSAATNLCGGSGLSGSQTCACTHGIGRMCEFRRSGASALPYGCDRQMAPCSVLQYELMKLGQSTHDAM